MGTHVVTVNEVLDGHVALDIAWTGFTSTRT
jgi:hypothetical protein